MSMKSWPPVTMKSVGQLDSKRGCIKASLVRGAVEGSIVCDTVSVGGSWSKAMSMKTGGHEDSRRGCMVKVKVLVSPVRGSELWMFSAITTDSVAAPEADAASASVSRHQYIGISMSAATALMQSV